MSQISAKKWLKVVEFATPVGSVNDARGAFDQAWTATNSSDRNTLIITESILYSQSLRSALSAVTTSARGFLKYGKYADDIATKADDAAEESSDDVNLPGGNGAPQATRCARVAKYGHLWQRASLDKAIARHAGPDATSWVSKTGKTIFENPRTGRHSSIPQATFASSSRER